MIRPDGSNNGNSHLKSISGDGNRKFIRILIVENEAIIAEDLRLRLEQMGYDVEITESARFAIDLAKQNRPDILLVDPDARHADINGAETAVILQGYFSEPLPVIFMSAQAEKEFPLLEVIEKYIYLKKPFSDEDFADSMEKAVLLKKEQIF